MPSDDLVLNVRQIAGYTETSSAIGSDVLLIQRGGLGGPYFSIDAADFVGTALSGGGDMAIGGGLSALSFQGGKAQFSNLATNLFSATNGSIFNLCVTGAATLGGAPLVTTVDLAAQYAATVHSFEGRVGVVCLWLQDIIRAGGAPNFSPVFGGEPRAPTPAPTSNSSRLATTAFVTNALGALTLGFAPLDSPDFTGVPTAPTPPLGSHDGTLATTAFVQTAIAGSVAGVSSFNTRTGIVTLTNADVTAAGGAVLNSPAFTGTPTAPTPPPGDISTRIATTAFVLTESGFAPLASPGFTGIPTAPTPTPGTNTTQLATTAYVQAAITGISLGVTTFNGRQGAVTLVANDITAAGGAILASPAFTGTPTAPNPPPGDSSTRIATTAYVQSLAGFAPLASPAFTGVPTAPTAAPGNNTTQLATTAFVEAAIANSTTGVASFNGRTGAVTLQANDISAAGGALLASPAFTGTPSAPTAAAGVNTTQLATCAYVTAAIVAAAVPVASTTAPLMNGTAAAGSSAAYSRGDHVHPTDTSRAPLTGAVFTGSVTARASGGDTTFSIQNGAGTNQGALYWAAASGFTSLYNYNTGFQWTMNSSGIVANTAQCAKPGGGSWVDSSDARIKTVVRDFTDGLAGVLQLNPVLFTFKGNDTPVADVDAGDPSRVGKPRTASAPYPGSPHYGPAVSGETFPGFVAQELEQVFPDMVTRKAAFIDGQPVSDLREVNTTPLIFALVNAVKELAARLAALEAT